MKILQSAKLNFRFTGSSDAIFAEYDYSFELGGREGCVKSYCEPVHLFNGRIHVSYRWDTLLLAYKINHRPSYGAPAGYLDDKKIACFGAFGADSLFRSAFRSEIDNVLKTGTPLQKKSLKKFLAEVKLKK
jgi:hypothetical protein